MNQRLEIRHPKTHTLLGWKESDENIICVPVSGEMESFIHDYNVLSNYDMGIAVELYNIEQKKIESFALLYAFRIGSSTNNLANYGILETQLSNLDILELLYFRENNK